MLHLARQLSRRPQQGAPPLVLAGASGLLQQLLGGAAAGEALQQGGAACGQARQYGKAARPARPAAPAYDDSGSEDESFMSLPEDLDEILALNPRLHHVMTLAREHQRTASATDTMLDAIEGASPGKARARRVTKSSLARLRVDQLREMAEQLGTDSRGTKDALLERLLGIAGGEAQQQAQAHASAGAAAAAADERVPREGVASRLRPAAAPRRAGGLPEASLRQHQRDLVQAAEYAHAFNPEEVADIFAEARGEDICIIDVRGRCPFTDFMVLATARSQRLAHMLASAVLHALKARAREVAPGVAPVIEGALDDSEWLVVDAGSVVAHVFLEGYREQYDLEGLWGEPGGRNITRVAPKQTVHTLSTLRAQA